MTTRSTVKGGLLRCADKVLFYAFAALSLAWAGTADGQNINLSALTSDVGVRFSGSDPNSGFNGRLVNNVGDFNDDGFDDFAVSSPLDPATRAVYIIFGKESGFVDLPLSSIAADNSKGIRITGTFSGLGICLSGAGDFDGDGCDDVIISTHGQNAFLVYGKRTGLSNLSLDQFQTSNANGFRLDHFMSYSVAGAGDFNNDGYDDIVVGSPLYDKGFDEDAGKVWVLFGGQKPHSNISAFTFVASDTNGFSITGAYERQSLGQSVASAGDFNNDGFSDIILSSPGSTYYGSTLDGTYIRGAAHVIFGKAGGGNDIALTHAALPENWMLLDNQNVHYLAGAAPYSSMGFGDAGDFNGDGYSDIIVGSQFEVIDGLADSGSAFITFGRQGTTTSISLAGLETSPSEGFRINGTQGSYLGSQVNSAGDVNGDGHDDFLIVANSSPVDDNSKPAPIYLVYGSDSMIGAKAIQEVTESPDKGFKIENTTFQHPFPPIPASAGDVNSDGFDDFIIYCANSTFQSYDGYAYLLFGKPAGQSSVCHWFQY